MSPDIYGAATHGIALPKLLYGDKIKTELRLTQKREINNVRQNNTKTEKEQYDIAQKSRKQHRRTGLIAVIGFLALITVMYTTFFPLPIYEEFESSPKAERIDIWGDEDAVKKKHLEMIEMTQEYYEKRRDEILDEVTDPGGPVGTAVHNKCLEILASEYPGYSMGNINWDIPEKNYTLSAEEADMILYLYSCQFDWDYFNGTPTNYIKWLYGFDNAGSKYEMKALGQTFELNGHGGYFMEQDRLNEARAEAKKEAKKAYWNERIKQSGAHIVLTLIRPFVDTAYASEQDSPARAYETRYAQVIDEYAREYGSSALDTIIYTNVSDQISGKISISVSNTPYYTSPAVKVENYEGSQAQKEAAKASANPMNARCVCLDYTETYTTTGNPIAWSGPYYSSYTKKGKGIGQPWYNPIDWEVYTHSQSYVIILCYAVTPSVDFTATANINSSGFAPAKSLAMGGT